jgi:hypothetical protein
MAVSALESLLTPTCMAACEQISRHQHYSELVSYQRSYVHSASFCSMLYEIDCRRETKISAGNTSSGVGEMWWPCGDEDGCNSLQEENINAAKIKSR